MGWRAFYEDGTELNEGIHGRPVKDGEEGKLLGIAQEDFGHNIAVDLKKGIIFIDYEYIGVQNGTFEIAGYKTHFWICDDTNIVGDLAFVDSEFVDWRDPETGRRVIGADGRFVKVRNDHLRPLTWRPIWFTRHTNENLTKIIGAQTTTPPEFGTKNVKKMVSLFDDGRIGVD